MSTESNIKLLICGSGNGAHAFAGIASSKPGTEVRVLSLYQDEAERWSKIMETADLEVTCHRRDQEPHVIKSKPALVTKNPEEAARNVDIIAFVLPAFAHKIFLEVLKPHIEPGVTIAGLPGASGLEFQVRGILGEKANDCTVMNFESLPWACRLGEFGKKCDVLGTKDTLVGAMQIGSGAAPKKDPVASLQYLLGEVPRLTVSGHLIAVSLMNPNACGHPSFMYGQWDGWDGKPVEEVPMFYTGVSEETAELYVKMSDECVQMGKVITEKTQADMSQVVPMIQWDLRCYPNDIADKTNMWTVLRTNAAYQGLKHPMKSTADGKFVPDFQHRYLTEDIPYGLAVIRGVGEIVGMKTPHIDKVLLWAQERVGKKYLEGDQFNGADVASTRAPQAYGIFTVEDMMG